jgi:HTH-type transcriptional regulator/antitoxin HigA
MNSLDAPFSPDWVSPPGDTILDLIEEKGWTQAELSVRLGYSPKHVNQLIKGKVPLSEEAAIKLELVLGSTVGFWLSREAKYRERMARQEAAERHAAWVDWLDVLPIKELMDVGAIVKRRVVASVRPLIVEDCLRFYGIASPDEWRSHYASMQASFRRSRAEQCDVGAISAWLRMGEQLAEKLDGPKYDAQRFQQALAEARLLTTQPPEQFEPKLRELLDNAGVLFVLVPAIPRAHVSGVARWLNGQRPMIQLSLYGKTNDKFWFSLFHEAAHILLHAKEKRSVFLDDPNHANLDVPEEHEANSWAANNLIPFEYHGILPSLQTKQAVIEFSQKLGIHPGIVVGRLQHDKSIPPNWMNDLKISFRFAPEDIFKSEN